MTSLRVLQSGISLQVSPTAISLPMSSPCLRSFGGDLKSFGDYQASIILGGSQVADHLEGNQPKGNQPKRNLSKRDDIANSNNAFSIEGRKSMEGILRYSPQ